MPNNDRTGPASQGCRTGKKGLGLNILETRFSRGVFYTTMGIVLPVLARKVLPKLMWNTTNFLNKISTKKIVK